MRPQGEVEIAKIKDHAYEGKTWASARQIATDPGEPTPAPGSS